MEGAEAHWLLVVSLGKLPVASLISPIRAWGASQTWGATTSTDPNWNWSENWTHWSSSTVSVPLSCCIHEDWCQWTWISIPLFLVPFHFPFWGFHIIGFQPATKWHVTNVSVTLSMLFCWSWSRLLFYLSEKRMNGWREMTGDSSNIGCLETLAVPSTNNSAQSALRALILLDCIQEDLYTLVNTKAQYTPLCIWGSSSRGMFYRVGDKPWLITEAHVTLLALHLSQTVKAPFLSIFYLYLFFSLSWSTLKLMLLRLKRCDFGYEDVSWLSLHI